MNTRVSQLLAVLFVASQVMLPQPVAFADVGSSVTDEHTPFQHEATPVGVDFDEADRSNGSENTPVAEGSEDQQTKESDEPVTKSDTQVGDIQPAAISGDFDIALEYIYHMNMLEIELSFDAGFSASAGDTMFLRWDTSRVDLEFDYVDPGLTLPLTWDFTDPEGATLTFRSDYDAPIDIRGIVRLFSQWELLPYDACVLSQNPYQSEMHLQVSIGSSSADIRSETLRITGPMCPGSPWVWRVSYVPRLNAVYATIRVPNNSIEGKSVTITYPTQRIHLDPGSYDVYKFANGPGSEIIVGTAVVTEGLVTITFDDFYVEGSPPVASFAWATLPATVISEACVPDGGLTVVDIEPITFVGIPGSVWSNDFEQILCDAAPITKVGRWISDNEIEWTIDTGDLLGSATIYDRAHDRPFAFDCTAGNITVEYLPGYEVPADAPVVSCSFSLLTIELPADSKQRAEITFRTPIDESDPATSYVNCAYAEVKRGEVSESFGPANVLSTAGLGGGACFGLFPIGGGDFLSNTVDKPEVESGETVTFTVNVSTSSDEWLSIALNNVLPSGFEIDESSITCEVLPLDYQGAPCFTRVGNELNVVVLPLLDDAIDETAPVNITLSFAGIVTGNPGDVIASEACSERIVPDFVIAPLAVSGDPTIPGGGVICDIAVVTIGESDDDSINPTPSNTANPTATVGPGTPTNETSPGATVDPTGTSGVTTLPETGNRGPSPTSTIFIAAIAASILIAAGIGMQLRPRDR